MTEKFYTRYMTITATRVPCTFATRTLYRLSAPTMSLACADPFEYVVLSRGREGDTCAFPSDSEGGILDFIGFGYIVGPSRWLLDDELDAYLRECIAQHERDGGSASCGFGGTTAGTP